MIVIGRRVAHAPDMTFARLVVPGRTYMITRRCTQREFLLAPSPATKQVFLYCLAFAAVTYKVQVHALVVMSNHYHLIMTDPHGNRPEFCHWLHLFVSKALNVKYQRGENFWSSTSYSSVHLPNAAAVLDKLLYTLTNPITAGLVPRLREWPGLVIGPGEIGKRLEATRPGFFFRPDGDMPASLRLKVTIPPLFRHLGAEGFEELVRRELKSRTRQIHRQRRAHGKVEWVGREAIMAQANLPYASPGRAKPDRGVTPRVACKDKWRRIEALQHLTSFRVAYSEAITRWRHGERDVVFPHGTYLMRVRFGVTCCPGPPD